MGTTTKMAGFGFPIQLLLLLSAEHRGQSHGPLSGTSRGLSLILSILSAVPKIKYSQQYRWWVLAVVIPPPVANRGVVKQTHKKFKLVPSFYMSRFLS
jgi:hypothetical protein